MQYDTIDSFLEELPALAAQAGDKLAEHHGLFLIKTGAKEYLIRLNNSQVTLEEPGQEYPNCIVEAEESLLLDMVNGKISPMKALLFGKARVQGDVKSLLRLSVLVP